MDLYDQIFEILISRIKENDKPKKYYYQYHMFSNRTLYDYLMKRDYICIEASSFEEAIILSFALRKIIDKSTHRFLNLCELSWFDHMLGRKLNIEFIEKRLSNFDKTLFTVKDKPKKIEFPTMIHDDIKYKYNSPLIFDKNTILIILKLKDYKITNIN